MRRNPTTERVHLHLDAEESARLAELCERERLTKSALLRRLIMGIGTEAKPSPRFRGASEPVPEPHELPPEPDVDIEPEAPEKAAQAPATPRPRPNLPPPRDLTNIAQPPASFRVSMGRGRVGR